MNYYTAVSPFWLVAVSVCRHSGLLLIAVSPFWFVAVLTIDHLNYHHLPVSVISHPSLPYNMVQPANSVIHHPIVSKPIPLDCPGKIPCKSIILRRLALTISEFLFLMIIQKLQ